MVHPPAPAFDGVTSTGRHVVLAPGVRIEPLVRQWAAWLMTLDPVNAALHLAGHQRPLLESFLRHPGRHAAAARDRRTASGPFAHLGIGQTDSVRRWLDHVEDAEAGTLAVGEALLGLLNHPDRPVNAVLSGAIERVTQPQSGGNGHSVRLLRTVLRRSIEPGTESVAVWPAGTRPHFLNTPRLVNDDRLLQVSAALRSDRLDAVLRLRYTPAPLDAALETLGLDRTDDHASLAALLRPIDEPAAPRERSTDRTGVDFLGHCSVLIREGRTALLADPITPPAADPVGLPPRLDAVLISHGHPDHLVAEALLALRDRIGLALVPATRSDSFADPSLRDCLLRLGIRNVVELQPYEQVTVKSAVVTALPFQGEHGGLDIGGKATWHVRTPSTALMLAADCACREPEAFDGVGDEFGAVDLLMTAMEPRGAPARWLYGPLVAPSSPPSRLDGADADAVLRLAAAVGARRLAVYGCDGPPGTGHLFGRPAPRTEEEQPGDTGEHEMDRLRRLAAARNLPVLTLDAPRRITRRPGDR
ncbi:MBL fold metallo-hydrolase [Streptomyces echinatus]|uniref:L-ascorbate metabolism protein UlaG (Beta-lactamase superfamily) n=1 Tax=Streptomyces echinatus TaxID=67293 RepID=A0A7W9UPP7_9ACTN|nr:MBL fold metallo-hydrolase [Streptomyces echinatus]MBB5926580.1 L-ascorbate metabolism protein UlaG (beta-lactamase superfamily) [Streptomyces echinatus]